MCAGRPLLPHDCSFIHVEAPSKVFQTFNVDEVGPYTLHFIVYFLST